MSKVAAIQMVSDHLIDQNLFTAAQLIQQAVDNGAELIVLPECFALMSLTPFELLEAVEHEGEGKIQDFIASQAIKHRVWIIAGTIPLYTSSDERKSYASCLVYNDEGKIVSRYDKIHLFDAYLPGKGYYSESFYTEPGNTPVVLSTPFGRIGLSVCYDLRFPELFRNLAKQQIDIIVVPSAFTYITGLAHWEVLLRARAIENLCYVVAANQGGEHTNNRHTYGHSMIIDPWGKVLSSLEEGEGVIVSELDLAYLTQCREQLTALQHIRLI